MLRAQFHCDGDSFLSQNGPNVQIAPMNLVYRGYFSQYRVQGQSEVIRCISDISDLNNLVS